MMQVKEMTVKEAVREFRAKPESWDLVRRIK